MKSKWTIHYFLMEYCSISYKRFICTHHSFFFY